MIRNGTTIAIATDIGNPKKVQKNGIEQFRQIAKNEAARRDHILFINLIVMPYRKAVTNIPMAITRCRGPCGMPPDIADAICPKKPTKAPAIGEMKPAAKNAGAESRAIEPDGEGNFKSPPRADMPENTATDTINRSLLLLDKSLATKSLAIFLTNYEKRKTRTK
jgi:hypothetical protein